MSKQLIEAQREGERIRTIEVEGAGEGGASSENFIFAIDTTTQNISPAGAWQDVTFSTNVKINGWTHTPSTAIFIVPVAGEYRADVRVNYRRQTGGGGGGGATFAIRSVLNGAEILGTHSGEDILQKGDSRTMSTPFDFTAAAGDIFKLQASSNKTTIDIKPGPTPAATITPIGATLHITRKGA